MKKRRRLSSAALAALCLAGLSLTASVSCASSAVPDAPAEAPRGVPAPEARFAVLSDIHVYDKSLGDTGAAFEAYVAKDSKLLVDSVEILDAAIDRLLAEKPDFVLISGDLTKDGERQSHELAAARLGRLVDAGIKVLVLPGNHDIDNPRAYRFLPSGKTEKVPAVNPAEFASIYDRLGYGGALARDPASLSYVAEPVRGLWVIALDSARYEDNLATDHRETGGRIRPQTLSWLKERLEESRRLGKTVIVSEHHPVMEHFDLMKRVYPQFIVADNWRLVRLLASYDVRVVFSGHFHANSVALRRFQADEAGMRLKGKSLYDIETGSLVTWPSPFRTASLGRDGGLSIKTERISQLPSYAAAGRDFSAESRAFVAKGLEAVAEKRVGPYVADKTLKRALSENLAEAMLAHYAGDASRPSAPGADPRPEARLFPLAASSYKRLIAGLYKERSPAKVELGADNELDVNLLATP
jgi:3',5'-cyclic AMP phosphodiesterase CpdA